MNGSRSQSFIIQNDFSWFYFKRKRAQQFFLLGSMLVGTSSRLHDYVRECQGKMAVYDFPPYPWLPVRPPVRPPPRAVCGVANAARLYYVLKRCIHSNNFEAVL